MTGHTSTGQPGPDRVTEAPSVGFRRRRADEEVLEAFRQRS